MSGTALDVILEPRLGARKSARRQRVTIGSDVPVWFDIRDDQTGALVPGATGVAALYWLPGTVEDESAAQPLTAVETTPGTWQVVVPAGVPGTYTVWLSIAEPIAQTAEAIFDVSSIGQVTLTSTGTPDWGQVQAVAAAAAVSAALPEAQRAGTKAGADAAKPFADDAAASEAIALDAADLARDHELAAKAAKGGAEEARGEAQTARDQALGAAGTTTANVAVAVGAAQAAQSALALSGSYPTLAAAAAAMAGLAEGRSVEVTSDSNVNNNGIWAKRGGTLVQTSAYTVSAIGNAVNPLNAKLADSMLVPPFLWNGRMFQAYSFNPFTLQVDFGQYLDDGSYYIRGHPDYGPQINAVLSKTGTLIECPPISFMGRPFQPLELDPWSKRAAAGVFTDTGEAWPSKSTDAAASLPRVVAEVISATEFRAHLKGGNPASNAYTSIIFKNLAVLAKNSDVWRCHGSYKSTRNTNGTFTLGQWFSGDGEWEFAVQPAGAADFIGGNAHGNEERTSWMVTLDGKAMPTTPGLYAGSCLEMFQQSNGFLPGSTDETRWTPKGPPVLDIVKHWTLTSADFSDMRLGIRLKFLSSLTLAYSYMCGMFKNDIGLGAGKVFTHGARDFSWQNLLVSDPALQGNDIGPEMILRSPETGLAVHYKAEEGWTEPGRRLRWNYSADLQKIYPSWFGTDPIPAGTVKYAACRWRFHNAD
jgi:hypothetical protein